jgi:hypothetical protein
MEGAGSLSGYRSIWNALRLRHGIHVSRHVVATLMREIDPLGVEEREKRRLHRRVYKREGPNACWHLDGRNVFIWEVVQGAAPPPGLQSRDIVILCADQNEGVTFPPGTRGAFTIRDFP